MPVCTWVCVCACRLPFNPGIPQGRHTCKEQHDPSKGPLGTRKLLWTKTLKIITFCSEEYKNQKTGSLTCEEIRKYNEHLINRFHEFFPYST